jgi:glycosyltransferase involved in cell wall biosynthesis
MLAPANQAPQGVLSLLRYAHPRVGPRTRGPSLVLFLTAFKSPKRATDVGDVESVPTLITVPARAERAEDLEPILQTLVSVRSTAPDAMVLVVDDRSPAPQAEMIAAAAAELDCAHVVQEDGEGRYAAFNVGLAAAAQHGMDVVVTDAGLIFDSPGWLDRLRARTGTDGTPAAVAGGAVIEPTGLIRQAGYFFSLYRRAWGTRLARVPAQLLDVHTPLLCPISTELALVRNAWIERVGAFDELLDDVPHGSLDYCLRVTQAGGQCVLEPTVRARELDDESPAANRLRVKHSGISFQPWAPEVI